MMAVATARAQQSDPSANSQSSLVAQAQPTAAASAASSGASTAAGSDQLGEVIVTATKRATDIQSVPLAITAITAATLENQNIQDFTDYALTLPQVSFTGSSPGSQQLFMRGVSASPAGNYGSGAVVGVYLDNQPITFPGGTIDLHMYDIARVELLPGPQGTLYGAASEAGTLRIITNQPDPSGFHGGYSAQLNTVYNGTLGGILEGFVNVPIASNQALRVVGWYERDSGYINNVHQTITYDNGFTIDNAPFVAKHYNPVTTEGGRAEYLLNINDNWSINASVIAQKLRDDGKFAQEEWRDLAAGGPITGALSVAQYSPETHDDTFVDRVLTVLGKIGDFNLNYTGSYFTRDTHTYTEYVDYTLAYQQYENIWPANPTMYDFSTDTEETYTNELRILSPTDYRVRFVAGVFQERQQSLGLLHEPIPGLNPLYWVGYGTPYILYPELQYLTDNEPVRRDWAGYIEANWDITSNLTATVGFRRFRYANSLKGFNGVGLNAYGFPPTSGIPGQQTCFEPGPFKGAPCVNLDGYAEGWGSTPKFNLSYKFDADRMVYATFSKGFRPGGVNQEAGSAPFGPDYLTNYEIGWKTSWLDHHLIFDGALYYEDWNNFQFSFTGTVGIPTVVNAAAAAVKGFETQLNWLVTEGLDLTASVAYNDSYLTAAYCGVIGANGKPITSNPCVVPGRAPFAPKAPDGAMLPGTPRWKGTATARYSFALASGTAFVEGDETYQSFLWPYLRTSDQLAFGQIPAYGYTDFSLGLDKGNWEAKLLVKNVFNRIAYTDIDAEIHGAASYAIYHSMLTPRLIGLQFSQQF